MNLHYIENFEDTNPIILNAWTLPFTIKIYLKDELDNKPLKKDEPYGLPKEDLGAEVDVEKSIGGDEIEEDVMDKGAKVEKKEGGKNGDSANDEGEDKDTGGEEGAEIHIGMATTNGNNKSKDIGNTIAKAEMGDNSHRRGQIGRGGRRDRWWWRSGCEHSDDEGKVEEEGKEAKVDGT